MAFEELKENTEEIQVQMKAYFQSNMSYYKLWGFKVAMKSTTMILKFSLIFICLSMVLLFCSVAGAIAIGKYLESYPVGFLIVGGVYLAGTCLLFLIKDKFMEGPVLKKFSEIFFND